MYYFKVENGVVVFAASIVRGKRQHKRPGLGMEEITEHVDAEILCFSQAEEAAALSTLTQGTAEALTVPQTVRTKAASRSFTNKTEADLFLAGALPPTTEEKIANLETNNIIALEAIAQVYEENLLLKDQKAQLENKLSAAEADNLTALQALAELYEMVLPIIGG